MRCLPFLLGLGLAGIPLQAAPNDHTVAGLRKLRATCFPNARTARPVACDWLSPTPVVVRHWPQLSQQRGTAAWLVNETPEGGTLIIGSTLPIEVAFTADNKRGLPHVRCWEANLTESVEALTRESRSGEAPPSSLGNKLLFATLADLGGATEGAKKLALAVFAESPNTAIPIAWALSLAANGQYASALNTFQRTGDLPAFRQDCEATLKRFPECWPARSAVETIMAGLAKKSAALPSSLSAEDEKLINEIASHAPGEAELATFQSNLNQLWVLEAPERPGSSPLDRLLARGSAAVPVLAAICESDQPTRYTGGRTGFYGFGSLVHQDPLRSGGDFGSFLHLQDQLPRPLLLGDLARLLLSGVLQTPFNSSDFSQDPAQVRAASDEWMATYGSLQGPDLLRALLKNLPPEWHSRALQPALRSPDEKWRAVLVEYVDSQPPSMETLNIVSQMTARPGESFHAAARKFLAKVKSNDDLLPEHFRNSSVPEETLRQFREHIDQQLEKIRQTVGESVLPSA